MHCQTHIPKPPIQSKQVFINSGHQGAKNYRSMDLTMKNSREKPGNIAKLRYL